MYGLWPLDFIPALAGANSWLESRVLTPCWRERGSQGWARATRWVSGSCQGWCYLAESSAAGQAAGAVGAVDGWTWASLGGKAAVPPEAVAASVCGWFGLGSGLPRAGTTFGLGGQQDGETTVWGGCSAETGLGQGLISIPDPTHPSVSWEASGP